MANFQRDQAVTLLDDYTAGATQSASFNTPSRAIHQFHSFGFQINVTNASSLNITAKIQATLDGTNWCDVPSASTTITANGSYMIGQTGNFYVSVRIAFTFTGGSATFQVYLFEKM